MEHCQVSSENHYIHIYNKYIIYVEHTKIDKLAIKNQHNPANELIYKLIHSDESDSDDG